MKKSLHTLTLAAALGCGLNATAAVPDGFYDSLDGKCGVELKNAVKALAAEHTVISYGDPDPDNSFHPVYVSTWTVFAESDTRKVDNVLCWWDMYSAINLWVSDGHQGLNIEHSVANSWWGGKGGSTEAYNDLHHLNPSNNDANNAKSNWPLGEIANAYWSNEVSTTGTPVEGQGDGATRVFQPYPSYMGDFARAYFYIFTIYDDIPWKDDYAWMYNTASQLTLKPWAYDLLLKWSAADPVSSKEADRNEAIYTYQKNRNPFIDCPQLADHIWGDKKNEPFHYSLYTPVEENPDIYPGWDEEFPDMMQGFWAPVSSDEDINEDELYFIVSPTAKRAMTYKTVAKNNAMEVCLYSPKFEERLDPACITSVPVDIATVKLEKAGEDAWYLGVYDPDMNFMGYINVTAKNTAKLSNTKAETCKATIAVAGSDNKTLVNYTLSDGDYTLQYNSSTPRFSAYKSNQNPIQLYRATDEILPPEDAGVGATGLDSNAEEVIIGIFDINGRKVDADSVSGLEKGIYIVVSNHGTKKIRR